MLRLYPVITSEGRGRRKSAVLLSARAVRKPTKAIRRMVASGRLHLQIVEDARPRTRGDCAEGTRPCPFVSCKHHLYLEVQPSGSIIVNFPLLEPHRLKRSCSLDEADNGPQSLRQIGRRMNMTRERVRGIETDAIAQIRASGAELPSITEFEPPPDEDPTHSPRRSGGFVPDEH